MSSKRSGQLPGLALYDISINVSAAQIFHCDYAIELISCSTNTAWTAGTCRWNWPNRC
ncbi:MAG TPA: hypothetical protein VN277_00365 [Acidiferrobacterales bacterium]|nr:hypothetical protein [Acidiferrobacterales bacterium]